MGWSKVVKGARPPLAVQENPRYFKVFSQILISGSDGKASACNAGDPGLILGSGKDPPEKEMAIHSSTLAWKIPWTEEPGRLQSTGSQRVGHN